jgi:hypothetical protein
VDHSFGILGTATELKNKNYIKFLVEMLDFERWTPGLSMEAGEQKYPAMDVLVYLQRSGKNVACGSPKLDGSNGVDFSMD